MRVVLFIIMFAICFAGFAQEEKKDVKLKAPKSLKADPEKEDQIILDVNWDYLLNIDSDVKLKPWSRGMNIYLMYDIPIASSNVSFAAGAGFSTQNYFSEARVTRKDSNSGSYSSFQPIHDSLNIKRTKLSTNFIDIPLEFRFRTNENNKGQRFKLAIGGKIGYLVNVHDKTIADNGDKFKSYVFPNVQEIRYGALARIGYGRVNLTGFYSLTPLFEDKKGDELIPLSIGISIIPF